MLFVAVYNGDFHHFYFYFTVVVPAPSTVPSAAALDQRAQRLTALQATALALQSRIQSHALRLSGAKEGALPQPKVSPPPKEVESGFQGVLPGLSIPCREIYNYVIVFWCGEQLANKFQFSCFTSYLEGYKHSYSICLYLLALFMFFRCCQYQKTS